MATMLLYNPNHKPPGAGGGQFAPKGGGSGGGSGRVSAARMARIEKLTSEASVKGGGMTAVTKQCAFCGKMLNGPMAGKRLPLPHSASWSHGMCPSCAKQEVAVLHAERAGRPLSKTLQRYVNRKHAIKADWERRVAQDAADHPGSTQADEEVVGMRLADIWQRPVRLGEVSADGHRRSWIMLMPQGNYEHPEYGKLKFTRSLLSEFKQNFDNHVRKIDLALDADHKATQGDSKATGWIESVEWRPAQPDGTPAGLWGCIDWTSYGVSLLDDRLYRYFSPEFGDYTDEATGKVYHNVIIGGALTNRPFLKVMPSVALAETSNKPWGSVSKSNLPKSCFLWVAGPNKSDWHLPVYESNGQGGRGPLNINAVKAAFGALHGARSGKAMSVPPSVRARIIALHNKYFGASATQAHEGMKGGAMSYQFATKTPLKAKAGGAAPSGSNHVADYDPGDEDDPTQFDEEADDTSLDDGEDGESYDEESDDSTMDDGEPDGDESDGFGGKKAPAFGRGKQMSRKTASKAGGRKMSETAMSRKLAEYERRDAERAQQLAELQYRDYTRGVDDILRTWTSGQTMTFFAAETASLPKGKVASIGGKRVQRTRTVALTAEAERRIRAFLLDEGYQLSERRRTKVLDLVQFLLSERAQVDLTRYGSSFDQESRKTISLASRRSDAFVGADLQEAAESLASQAGKEFATLSLDEKLRYYTLAEQEA